MPEWDQEPLRAIKPLVIRYVESFNLRSFSNLLDILDSNVEMIKSSRIVGKENVIAWLTESFAEKPFSDMYIELKDATAGTYSDGSVQTLLWFEIYTEKHLVQRHCESLLFVHSNGWKLHKIFGITYEPSEHEAYFDKFLPYSE